MYQQYFGQAKSAIGSLSAEELKHLLNHDEHLEERVNNVLDALDQEKNVILAHNREIAEQNVNMEPEIVERKSRISELSEQGESLCSSIQDLLKQLKLKKGDKTPGTVLALLESATTECEENSENIASKFQDTEITIDEYLEKFTAARKLMHTRKFKTEKMLEIMQKQSLMIPPDSKNIGHNLPVHASTFYQPHYASNLMPMPDTFSHI